MASDKPSWKHFDRLRFSSKHVNKRLQKIEKSSLRHAHRFVTTRLNRLSTVRRNVSVWIVLVMLLIGVSATQWMLSRASYTQSAYVSGGSYSEGVLGPLETLNPIFAQTSAERSAAKLLFASLYQYDTTGNIKKDLADGMTVNEAETEYTISMKRYAKWSDGQPLTADDVVFTVKLMANPQVNSSIIGWSFFKIEKIDNYTVKFTLPAAYAPFKHTLTFPVLPQHILKDISPVELREHAFSKSPVTSGPFSFRLLQNATSDGSKKVVHMVANKNYHSGVAKLERFQLYTYLSTADIAKSLRTREITGTPELSYQEQSEEVKSLYESESHTINNGVFALYNNNSLYLQPKSVRQALSLSVPTAELRKLLPLSSAELKGPVLDRFLSSPAKEQSYDIKKAQELLDSSGWTAVDGVRQKDGKKMSLRIVALKKANYEIIANKLAEIWKNQLQIDVEVKMVDTGDVSQDVLQTVLKPRNFDVLVYELGMGGDPDPYGFWHSSRMTGDGLNFANYNNPIANDALSSGRSKLLEKQRTARYDKFTEIWQEDAPALPLYQPKIDYIHLRSSRALNSNVILVNATDRYADILYWAVGKDQVYKTP